MLIGVIKIELFDEKFNPEEILEKIKKASDFEDLASFHKMQWHIIHLTSLLEVQLSNAISYHLDLHLLDKEQREFILDYILHSSVLPIAGKIKLVRRIVSIYGLDAVCKDLECLPQLIGMRNTIAHQVIIESKTGVTFGTIKGNGEKKFSGEEEIADLYNKFIKLYVKSSYYLDQIVEYHLDIALKRQNEDLE